MRTEGTHDKIKEVIDKKRKDKIEMIEKMRLEQEKELYTFLIKEGADIERNAKENEEKALKKEQE